MTTLDERRKAVHKEISKIVGSEVTDPKQLTIGRWYALSTATTSLTKVHAQYRGFRDGLHRFETCNDDVENLNIVRFIVRQFKDGKWVTCKYDKLVTIHKFTTHPDNIPVPAEPVVAVHFVDAARADIDSVLAEAAELNAKAATLVSEANVLLAKADAAKLELANQLAGYLPEVPKSRSLCGKPPSFF